LRRLWFCCWVVLLLGACSHAPKETAAVEQQCATCEAKLEELKNREAQLASKERELQQKAQELEQQKAAAATTQQAQADAGDLMLPPHAKPGECYARVWVPPKYKTVTEKVLKKEASSRYEVIPAYKTITVTEMVSPPQTKTIEIPAVYTTVTRKEKISDGHMEWRSILCQTNMTRDRIAQIQRALKAKGFDPGPIDGVIGSKTMAAVRAFQRKNNLPVDKYLNIATVKALGVSTH